MSESEVGTWRFTAERLEAERDALRTQLTAAEQRIQSLQDSAQHFAELRTAAEAEAQQLREAADAFASNHAAILNVGSQSEGSPLNMAHWMLYEKLCAALGHPNPRSYTADAGLRALQSIMTNKITDEQGKRIHELEDRALAAEAENARLRSEYDRIAASLDDWQRQWRAKYEEVVRLRSELEAVQAQLAQAVAALEHPDKTLHRYVKGTHSSDCGACRVLALLRGTEMDAGGVD